MNGILIGYLLQEAFAIGQVLTSTSNALTDQRMAEELLVSESTDDSKVNINTYCYGGRALKIRKRVVVCPENLSEEIEMSYEDYIAYLLHKYGPAKCNYFYSSACELRNKNIDRTNEGLICHHMAEECGLAFTFEKITNPNFAKEKPFAFYHASNFVYCNYLEHLLLHLKITLDDINDNSVRNSIGADIGGTIKIIREINTFFDGRKLPPIKQQQAELIKNRYEDYLIVLRFFANVLKHHNFLHLCPLDKLVQDPNGVVVDRIKHDVFGY